MPNFEHTGTFPDVLACPHSLRYHTSNDCEKTKLNWLRFRPMSSLPPKLNSVLLATCGGGRCASHSW